MTVSALCSCPAAAENETIKNYSITLCDTASQLNALQWNRHIPSVNVLMQHDNLLLLEKIQPDMQFKYVLVNNGNRPVGAMYFQVVMFHANQLINYFPENAENKWWMRLLKTVSSRILNMINVPMLVSGNVFMTGENGFYFTQDVDADTRAKILRKTIREVVKAHPHIKATLVSDLYAPKTVFDSSFKNNGYHEISVESDMSISLNNEWETFDDYLTALSSKYRVRAKKVFSLTNGAAIQMRDFSVEDVRQNQDRLNYLYAQVMDNAEFKLAELNRNFFYEQKKQLPDSYKVFGYFTQSELIGFISVFHFGKRIEVHYTGMEHDRCKPIHLYQRMMYDVVKFGIENNAERLHFGRTAPEIKSTIGAVPSSMYGYVKHFNPIFNFLFVRNYTANLKPRNYTIRNPFK